MNQVLYVNAERRDQIIADAARRQTTVVLSRRDDVGWKVSKARFVGCDAPQRCLLIEPPPGETLAAPQIGELMGVTFRRGHKKCLFNSVVLEPPGVDGSIRESQPPIVLMEPPSGGQEWGRVSGDGRGSSWPLAWWSGLWSWPSRGGSGTR